MRPCWRSGGVQGTEYERCLPELLCALRRQSIWSGRCESRKLKKWPAQPSIAPEQPSIAPAASSGKVFLRSRRQEYEAVVRSRERFEVRRAGHATSCRTWRKAPPSFEVPHGPDRMTGGRTDVGRGHGRRRPGWTWCGTDGKMAVGIATTNRIAENYREVADYKRARS
jgi:hypothetical protein